MYVCVHVSLSLYVATAGETAIGKSALLESLFDTEFDHEPHLHSEEPGIEHSNITLSEGGVDLDLHVTCSVAYGDQLDRTNTFKPISDYIDEQFESYLQVCRHVFVCVCVCVCLFAWMGVCHLLQLKSPQ